ncbi:MAG: tetratricopeptide repeat protein, partial [Muribaculaceae bacterium]|nr:tetratricopeptide repeat protein [Muribaculaceae bacterium]
MWDRSGIGEKLREISELHEQGADVMMGAFAQLKSYAFFHDVANWFRAFDPENSHLTHLKSSNELLDLIEMSPGMCDSDKFSLGLSMGSLPDAQKRALSSHLAAQSQQIAEVKLASLTTERDNRRSDAADFIHDIYRFFRLYRRKSDFNDPFASDILLNEIDVLHPDVDDVDTLLLLVNLGLKGQQWESVIKLLQRLRDIGAATEQNFQQMGYCYQRLGNYKQAIECYNKAALIDATNRWTISRLAASHRMAGNPAEALRYYREIEKSQSDDLKLAMNIGYTLLELGKDSEAAEYFFKVDVLDEKSHRALRPLAWSLLRSRQLEQAETYYKRILENDPTADDYLNMGHLALVSRRMSDAINFYRLYIDMKDGDIPTFVKAFMADAESLTVMGVDPMLPPLILDHIRYTQN